MRMKKKRKINKEEEEEEDEEEEEEKVPTFDKRNENFLWRITAVYIATE